MDRKTIELETKGGHKYAIKEYLSFEEIEPSLKITDDIQKSNEMVKLMLVSLDGSTEDPYGRARKLPFNDYVEIAKAIGDRLNADFPMGK